MTKLTKWVVLVALACLWACGSPEQATIDQFFMAARSNDSSTVAAMSAVGPPGTVESWEVVEVGSRSQEPFELPELLDRFETVTKERDAAVEAAKQYLLDNQEALEQIIPKMREDPDYEYRGKLGEIQEEWLRISEERKEKEHVFQELRRTVEMETRLASKSVVTQASVEELDGDIAVTEMLVKIKSEEGGEHPFKVTLQKYDLSKPETDRVEPARWIIADIEGATPEAQQALEAIRSASAPAARARASESSAPPAESSEEEASSATTENESTTRSRRRTRAPELRGVARVQILKPETKVEGNDVISTIRVRNVSRGSIRGFTVSEHWYDEQGNTVRGGSRTHRRPFQPGEVIELQLKTRKNPNFFQNQFEFTHANGEVKATVVDGFPEQAS